MKNCALICAYNEEAAIEEIAIRTEKYVDSLVIVDDGSKDNTTLLASQTKAEIIVHEINKGKGKALQTGFNHFFNSDYDNIITIDADGQHPPEYIPKFIESLEQGYDAIIGFRDFKGKNVPVSRRFANKMDAWILSQALKQKIKDPQNGFRAFKKQALERAVENITNQGFGFEIELLIKMIRQGSRIGWLKIPTIYSEDIKSHIKPIKHVKDSLKLYWDVFTRQI